MRDNEGESQYANEHLRTRDHSLRGFGIRTTSGVEKGNEEEREREREKDKGRVYKVM
jgi:hypothetical protein